MKSRIRINKYLSLCGMGSRRKVEKYILSGRIKINGRISKSFSAQVDINSDTVELDNRIIVHNSDNYYLILNKPRGYITTMDDEKGRPTVMDLVPERYKNAFVFPVGRLDKDTEGLLLITNDGDFAYYLTHPKFGVEKEYLIELDNPLDEKHKIKIEKGIFIEGKKTNPAKIEFHSKSKKFLKMIISEGKKRQIRLTFKKFSYSVKKLKRISFGPLKLGRLESGSYRLLKRNELKILNKYIGGLKIDKFS